MRQTASEDGAVLLDVEQGICFALNPIGLKIWELLKQHLSLGEIVDSLAGEFSVSRDDIAADVRDFVAELEAQHLVAHGVAASAKRGWLTRLLLWKFDGAARRDLGVNDAGVDGKHQ